MNYLFHVVLYINGLILGFVIGAAVAHKQCLSDINNAFDTYEAKVKP